MDNLFQAMSHWRSIEYLINGNRLVIIFVLWIVLLLAAGKGVGNITIGEYIL